jgi:hypothetical protein
MAAKNDVGAAGFDGGYRISRPCVRVTVAAGPTEHGGKRRISSAVAASSVRSAKVDGDGERLGIE